VSLASRSWSGGAAKPARAGDQCATPRSARGGLRESLNEEGSIPSIGLFFRLPIFAAAAGVPLSDLFGYSIVADWTVAETDVKNNAYGPYSVSKRFVEKIYVSTQGKLFRKREGTIGSGRGRWSYENYHVSSGSNEEPHVVGVRKRQDDICKNDYHFCDQKLSNLFVRRFDEFGFEER
jgi:hypothetical protein